MADQTELNCLLIDNLADLEAAGHQIDEHLTPMIVNVATDLVANVMHEAGWTGEYDDLDNFWFASPDWRELEAGSNDYLCHFAYRPTSHSREDWFDLSALLGVGRAAAGFYLDRRYLGGRSAAWSRLLAAEKDTVATLERVGLLYDHQARTFFVPVALDRAALIASLSRGAIEDALAPFGNAAQIAIAAAPLLAPIIDALRQEALK
jgi:hypothetical protein